MARSLEDQGLQGELEEGRFAGFLQCKGGFCGEIVVVGGDYSSRTHYQVDEGTGEEIDFTDFTYVPHTMHPPPPVIHIPKGLRADARLQLKQAFGLLWSDYGACATRLRIVIELLLDQLGIPRNGEKGRSKNARLDLFDRIGLLTVSHPQHEKSLTALRYVGNVGSHEGKAAFDDLLDCFELLEDVLIELIDERKAKLDAKADRIITRKGRPASP